MTPEQEQALLNATIAGLDDDLRDAWQVLLGKLRDGVPPRDAVQEVIQSFAGEFEALLTQAFGAIISASVGTAAIGELEVGAIQLSRRMYERAQDVSVTVQAIVDNHARGFLDARRLMLEIFEGYEFREEEPLRLSPNNRALPDYLRIELLNDSGLAGEMNRLFARAQAEALKTPALRAAYLELLDAIEQGAGQRVLLKKLEVAWNEKMRYFARRIAETELHRAYIKRRILEMLDDSDVEYVQVRRVGTSNWACICDLIVGRDRYGLGRGVYPKRLAPMPPYHPMCLPGDALITSAVGISAVSKRWYDGDLIVITTASGKNITATVNHPILTRAGWVAAGKIDVGTNVVCRVESEPVSGYSFVDDDHQNMPTSIAEIADSFLGSSKVTAREVPVSAEDFHGDGMASQVAVIGANRELWDRMDAKIAQSSLNGPFMLTDADLLRLARDCGFNLSAKRLRGSAHSVMGLCSECEPILSAHLAHSNEHGLGASSDRDSGMLENGIDWAASDAELARYIQAGSTGEVFFDDVIRIDRKRFSGHVYNLETEQGHYTCNGIVTHNCRCVVVPRLDIPLGTRPRENPEADQYFLRSVGLSLAGRIMGSQAKAQQALSGQDPIKLVNTGKPEGYQIKTP